MSAKVVKIAVGENGKAVSDKDTYRITPSIMTINWEDNPRADKISDEKFNMLKDDIKANGQINPCLVYVDAIGKMTLSSGYHRAKAVIELIENDPDCKDMLLLVRAVKTDDKSANGSGALCLNIRDNNIRNEWTLSDKAKAAMRLRTEYKYRNADIARAFGVTQPTVETLFKIEELPEEIKEAVDIEALTVTDAVQTIKTLSPEDKSAVVAEAIKKKKTTGKGMKAAEVREAVTKAQDVAIAVAKAKANGTDATKTADGKAPAKTSATTVARVGRSLKQLKECLESRKGVLKNGMHAFPVSFALLEYLDSKITEEEFKDTLTKYEVTDENETDDLLEYEDAAVSEDDDTIDVEEDVDNGVDVDDEEV